VIEPGGRATGPQADRKDPMPAMRLITRRLVPLAVAAFMAAACTSSPAASAGASPAVDSPSALPSPVSTRPSQVAPPKASFEPSAPVTGEVPPDVMDAARAELAKTVGVDAAASATVVDAEAVTWPDGSLGCPQPGMMYVQMVIPGYRIVFEVDGTQYDMRVGQGGAVTRCESGRPLPT
jgi:hypothetical protein